MRGHALRPTGLEVQQPPSGQSTKPSRQALHGSQVSTEAAIPRALRSDLQEIFAGLRLKLHPEKTRLVETGVGKEGFEFLGCHFRIVKSRFKGRTYLFRWPSEKSMKAVRARIRELTVRKRLAGVKDVREVIAVLNPVLRGWGNYFRTGNASDKFNQLDSYVWRRLVRYVIRRGGQRRKKDRGRPVRPSDWPHERFVKEFGLHQLRGTIRYPGKARQP